MAGAARNYVGAIERGEINPTFRVLLKLCSGLRVSRSAALTEADRIAELERRIDAVADRLTSVARLVSSLSAAIRTRRRA